MEERSSGQGEPGASISWSPPVELGVMDQTYPHTRIVHQVSEETVCVFDAKGVPRRVADLTEDTTWDGGLVAATEVTLRWGGRDEELFGDRPSAMRFVRDNAAHFLAGNGIVRLPGAAPWWYTPEGQRDADADGGAGDETRLAEVVGNLGWVTSTVDDDSADDLDADEADDPPIPLS